MDLIIVDDNKTFRESLKYYIEHVLMHTVLLMASDGKEFLNYNKIHEADIILIDIEMPVMNGIDAAKKALNNNAGLKILAITSYSDKAYLMELIGVGFKGCVFKNNIYEELQDALTKLLNNQQYWPKDMIIEKKEK